MTLNDFLQRSNHFFFFSVILLLSWEQVSFLEQLWTHCPPPSLRDWVNWAGFPHEMSWGETASLFRQLCLALLVGSELPNQESNVWVELQSPNHWATRVFPLLKSSVTLLWVPRPTPPSQPRLDLSKKEIPLGSFIDTPPTPCPLHILM